MARYVYISLQMLNKLVLVLHEDHALYDSSLPGTGKGVRFLLRGTTYQNNSLVTLEDIGEVDNALLCVTDQPACCLHYTRYWALVFGNWFFPNGSRIPSFGRQWNIYRNRGQMVVNMHRRRGGVTGIYCCMIPDAMNVTQTIYIGVYTADAGE